MTRLLCFGDLHLGARAAHEREPGDGLRDQREVLERIVELAKEHRVDAIVCAGDIFEGPTVTPEQYALMQQAFSGIDCDVITITGNGRHDCAMRNVKAPEVLADTLDVFTRPESVVVNNDTLLCLLPWVHPGRLVAERDGGDRDEVHADAAQLLLRIARDLRDEQHDFTGPIKHRVLVFHGSIEGAGLPNGIPIDTHASDILPIDGLLELGFDAIVASHIHVPQVFTSYEGSWRTPRQGAAESAFFYTGSPLPLNFGEGGYEHGVWLLDLIAGSDTLIVTYPAKVVNGPPIATATFLPIASRRFVTVDVDLTTDAPENLGLDETDAVAAAIATHMPIDDDIVRVRIRGSEEQARRVDTAALKDLLADTHKAYLAFDTVRGTRARVDVIDEDITPLAAVALYAAAVGMSDDHAAMLREDTAHYLDQLGVAS